jgi:hypothetical protein
MTTWFVSPPGDGFMQRRTYVTLSASLVGVLVGGPVLAIVYFSAPTRAGYLIAGGITLLGALIGGLVGRHDHIRRWDKIRHVVRARRQLGLEYRAKVPAKELEPFRSLELFQNNRLTPATDWMQGVYRGESVLLFDFVPSGGSQATRLAAQAVVLFPESAAGLPVFQLRPRNALRDFLGDDISFDPDAIEDLGQRKAVERFTRSYVLASVDEPGVRTFFTANVLGLLQEHAGWTILCDGQHLLLMRTEDTAILERPAYLKTAWTLRMALLEARGEQQIAAGQPNAVPVPDAFVPGKERGTGYRVAQIMWRITIAIVAAAGLGALAALKIVRRGNLLVVARNGALIGLAILAGLLLLLGLFLAGRMLYARLFSATPVESEEPS